MCKNGENNTSFFPSYLKKTTKKNLYVELQQYFRLKLFVRDVQLNWKKEKKLRFIQVVRIFCLITENGTVLR